MYTASANNPREDSVFGGKVKAAIVACDGSLVPALGDFEERHRAALEKGMRGIGYAEFIAYLRDHGVSGLSEREVDYLCSSFDDGVAPKKNDVISAATFTRHLTGLNHRRMKAVLQAWQVVLEATGRAEEGDDGKQQTVPADALMTTYRAAASTSSPSGWGGNGMEAKLESTFSAPKPKGSSGEPVRGPALFAKSKGKQAAAGDEGGAEVTRSDFVAFYAGLSPGYSTDEAFEVAVLKEWAADRAQQPKMQSTQRDWGEDGDPLAIVGTHYVRDALNMGLGMSSKSYNYSHMTRKHPFIEPLPPLDRVRLMESVAQHTYKPYSAQEQTAADPLATRRGQSM